MFHYTAYDGAKKGTLRYENIKKKFRVFPEFTWSDWERLQKFKRCLCI
jgi:hypothetical protein